MFFYIIYINHDFQLLARVRKLVIIFNKFKRLSLKKGSNIIEKNEKERI